MLSRKLRIPLFAKDSIKERLGAVLGAKDRAASGRLGVASIALMYQQAEIVLASGFPAMIESPLLPNLAADEIEETSDAGRDAVYSRYSCERSRR